MSEIQLQALCFQYLWNNYPATRRLFFHVPNGGNRDAREGAQLKASGVVAGIPDMILIHKGRAFGFEMKTLTGSVSPAQQLVHQSWAEDGTPVYIIRTFEEFQQVVLQLLGEPIQRKEVA